MGCGRLDRSSDLKSELSFLILKVHSGIMVLADIQNVARIGCIADLAIKIIKVVCYGEISRIDITGIIGILDTAASVPSVIVGCLQIEPLSEGLCIRQAGVDALAVGPAVNPLVHYILACK